MYSDPVVVGGLGCGKMGGALSHFFQSGHALLSSSHNRTVSEQTRRNIRDVFDALRANPKVTIQRLEGLLSAIPRSENILQIYNEEGYNLLQKCVGLNNVEMTKWCLTRNIDINRGACSLPLHIACLKGYVGGSISIVVMYTYAFQLRRCGRSAAQTRSPSRCGSPDVLARPTSAEL